MNLIIAQIIILRPFINISTQITNSDTIYFTEYYKKIPIITRSATTHLENCAATLKKNYSLGFLKSKLFVIYLDTEYYLSSNLFKKRTFFLYNIE